MLTLKRPEPDRRQIQAMAASGSSGVARKYQQRLKEITRAELEKAVGR